MEYSDFFSSFKNLLRCMVKVSKMNRHNVSVGSFGTTAHTVFCQTLNAVMCDIFSVPDAVVLHQVTK